MVIAVIGFVLFVAAVLFAGSGRTAHASGDNPKAILNYFLAVLFACQHLILFTLGYLF